MPRIPAWARWAALLWLGLSLLLVQVHAHEINFGPKRELRAKRHDAILAMTGEAPWTYRVAMPAVAEVTERVIAPVFGRSSLEAAYIGWHFAAVFGFLLLFHAWLRTWLDPAWTVAGVLLAAALHAPTYRFYWFGPDSAVDLVVWVAAALLARRGRDAWLVPLAFLGSLNRETAVFVLPIWAALRWGELPAGRIAALGAAIAAAWAAPFVGLRLVIGLRPWSVSVPELLRDNLQPDWLAYALAFFGALLVLPWLDLARAPAALRRLALVLVPTYLPLQLAFGRIREIRLFLPLLLVLVPLALLALARRAGEDAPPGGASR